MKVSIEQIECLEEERVSIYCHDDQSNWVKNVKEAALGQVVVCGYKANVMYRLNLLDVFYFEVVDGNSFIYTQKDVYSVKEKLYEFEKMSCRSPLFRCSKSMILNADKIDYVRPSLSGRFEAVLSNGEIVIVSRKYVQDLKSSLGI